MIYHETVALGSASTLLTSNWKCLTSYGDNEDVSSPGDRPIGLSTRAPVCRLFCKAGSRIQAFQRCLAPPLQSLSIPSNTFE